MQTPTGCDRPVCEDERSTNKQEVQCAFASLTSTVGCIHGIGRQSKLTHEGAELPGGQRTAEHAHGLEEERRRANRVSTALSVFTSSLSVANITLYLLELRRVQSVLYLLGTLRQTLPTGEEGEEPLLDLGVAQNGSHHLWGAHARQVHCRRRSEL